ncbi:MAG: helix-turn-helix transcriptional regulator [Gemmatimonadaceae bacterium]
MQGITAISASIVAQRLASGMSQRELADRVGTAQPAVARLEQGSANPTLETLERYAEALGCEWRIELVPRAASDATVERYKVGVDRSLLRENLKRTPDERLRSLADWERSDRELRNAMRKARAK